MPSEKISNRMKGIRSGNRERELQALLTATQEDLATIRTAFNTLVAKLNADAGVTDTNYAPIGTLNLQL